MTQRSNLPALELLLKTGKGVYAKGDSFSPLPLGNLKKDNQKWGDGDIEDRDSMEGFLVATSCFATSKSFNLPYTGEASDAQSSSLLQG